MLVQVGAAVPLRAVVEPSTRIGLPEMRTASSTTAVSFFEAESIRAMKSS